MWKSLDVWLPIGIGLLTFALAIMGVVVTIYPPGGRKAKVLWGLGFFLAAISGVALIAWQAVRSVDAQTDLQKQINDLPNKFPKPPTAQENAQAMKALENQGRPTKEQPNANTPSSRNKAIPPKDVPSA